VSAFALPLFAFGFVAIGVIVGAGGYHLLLPELLARRGLAGMRALWDEVEAVLLARALRPTRGRHLVRRTP
jgi:hypothetical protein